MKVIVTGCVLAALSLRVAAEPLRVAVLDFEDRTAVAAAAGLGGAIDTKTLAEKGLYPLEKALVKAGGVSLLDRRDFLAQVAASGSETAKPSFLHAAQALNADVVLRGRLLGFSTEKRVINQGGFKADYSRLSLRVGLEALDATDGTIVGIADGTARKDIRLTDADQTVLGEDTALSMLDEAVGVAVPDLKKALDAYVARNAERPRVNLSVGASEDPALVEIDGILVGTTPLEGFSVYAGDHVLTVGKPGYRDVTKRILLTSDVKITVPLFRAELTADEVKEILEKARVNAYIGIEPALIIEQIERAP